MPDNSQGVAQERTATAVNVIDLMAALRDSLKRTADQLRDFVRESNRIEGILREPTAAEIDAHFHFGRLQRVGIGDLKRFVAKIQPDAELRNAAGMDVRVGRHVPPRGGPHISDKLLALLDDIASGKHTPHSAHLAYETLHPFTDGNGRSGRALWLWMMHGKAPLGFLHTFYYQTLDATNGR